jgi:hypothetical protein
MKKTFLVFTILGIAVLAFGVTSPALAAAPLRGGPGNGGGAGGNGNGHQGALGMGTGVPVKQNIALDGVLFDLIHDNLVDALGILPAELVDRLEAGETISQIGLSLGFDMDTISEILTQARADALIQAVDDGLITQEQADWWASRGNRNPAAGYGDGICDGTGDCLNDS